MRGVPYSDNGQCEWETRIATIGGQAVTLLQPVTPTTSVNVPSISIGANPTFTVGTIKRTVAEILADEVHAPITCQALLESANTAVIGPTVGTGYHTLPPSGRLVHEHLQQVMRNYYQTVNSANSTSADTADVVNHVTQSGFPSSASQYVRYNSWKTSGSDTINTNTDVFDAQTYGFKAKVAGTYKIHVHMHFQTSVVNQDVGIRLAKGALANDLQNSVQENPGPLANTTAIRGNVGVHAGKVLATGTAQLTHIMVLAVNDEVSVYTIQLGQNHGAGNNCNTREGYSQLLVEYIG